MTTIRGVGPLLLLAVSPLALAAQVSTDAVARVDAVFERWVRSG